MEQGSGGPDAADAPFRLEAWSADGTATLTASAAEPEGLLLAGLNGVLVAAGGDRPAAPEEAADAAVPIRGQGADLAALFAELAADLLAQLDANGPGLDRLRLDGVLQTDDGGYSAWGYALGTAAADPPPVGLALDGDPEVDQERDGLALRATLRRTA